MQYSAMQLKTKPRVLGRPSLGLRYREIKGKKGLGLGFGERYE